MANGDTISRRIAEAEAKLSVQRAEQAAEFADLRAAEASDVRDIEARMNALEQELTEVTDYDYLRLIHPPGQRSGRLKRTENILQSIQ